MDNNRTYKVIIIGGGASGLMCAASPYFRDIEGDKLLLEGTKKTGTKLLMSAGGRCNITHDARGKELLKVYGDKAKKFRKAVYRHGPEELRAFLSDNGINTVTEEDGRVFPESMKAADVRECLVNRSENNNDGGGNNFNILTEERVTGIEVEENIYRAITEKSSFLGRNIIIATGGMSYPETGSDGAMLDVLRGMGIDIFPCRPALVPVTVDNYPYMELAGVSVDARVSVHRDGMKSVHEAGPVLFTHKSFSGPAVLNISAHADDGARLAISYIHPVTYDDALKMTRSIKSGKTLAERFNIPRSLANILFERAGDSPKKLAHLLTEDTFVVTGTEGFKNAMVTEGGVALSRVDESFQSVKYPGIYIIGEALDISGPTGGYNLQFGWSAAQTAAEKISMGEE